MQKITTFLWFDRNSEEAMNFYVDTFNSAPGSKKDSKIVSIKRYPAGPLEGPMEGFEGQVLTAVFELAGQRFMALDGGPIFKFSESISLYVECKDQEEIDYFWEKLSAYPNSEQCGWLKDKYGLSWQIVPTNMEDLMRDSNPEVEKRLMNALLSMKKIVISKFEEIKNN